MYILKLFILVLILSGAAVFIWNACSPGKKETKGEETTEVVRPGLYDFLKPVEKIKLPKSLKEISGLSYYKDNQLICVNDEEGKIFMFDIALKEIVREIDFGKAGDYEGVEFVHNEVYVMKSNGKIKVLKIETGAERELDLSNADVVEYEGLGYDTKTNSLLLAVKKHAKGKDAHKLIYSYDIADGHLFEKYRITPAMVRGKNGNADFGPSGIAVHPISAEVYIVSSQGKKLLILNHEGHKKTLIELDNKLFRQPEGICFAPNGDLYISSEGEDKKGYILKFIQN